MNFYTVLGLIFLILKLCGAITWPWVWVVCPFWIPFVIHSVVFLFAILRVYVFSTKQQREQMRRIKENREHLKSWKERMEEIQKSRSNLVILICLSLLIGGCSVSKPGLRCPEITKGSFKK
jgi:H+/Cl- antiporter ClcA